MQYLNHSGRTCLDRVEERDIDLLLLEELICEIGMRDLMAALVLDGLDDPTFPEASNSISTASDG